jgi:maltose alpha-D-glucosyltransferase/alpha-amylase
MGSYLTLVGLLGRRTGELHLALAAEVDDPAFAPEAFTPFYRRSLYQSMRNLAAGSLQLLRKRLKPLPEPLQARAREVLERQSEIMKRFRAIHETPITAQRIRVHGDFHLGQVLYTGNDFVIIDFEGEPARPLSERRLKRTPLRDVAGMLRSFDYAAHTALFGSAERGAIREKDVPFLLPWARSLSQWSGSAFLRAYLPPVQTAGLVPPERDQLALLLRVLLLDKATYELGYELNNRPGWSTIPIRGILDLLGSGS